MDHKTKAAVLKSVEKIAERDADALQLPISAEAQAAVAGLVDVLASTLGSDLESYAHHAKRKALQPEDVILFARRNEQLKAHLEATLGQARAAKKGRSKNKDADVEAEDSQDD